MRESNSRSSRATRSRSARTARCTTSARTSSREPPRVEQRVHGRHALQRTPGMHWSAPVEDRADHLFAQLVRARRRLPDPRRGLPPGHRHRPDQRRRSTSSGPTARDDQSTTSSWRSRPTAGVTGASDRRRDRRPGRAVLQPRDRGHARRHGRPDVLRRPQQRPRRRDRDDGRLAAPLARRRPDAGSPSSTCTARSTTTSAPISYFAPGDPRGLFLGDYIGLETITGDDVINFFTSTIADGADAHAIRADHP